MATERFGKLPTERQMLILKAAMSEFAAGISEGKLENIAKAAGVTKGLLYYYFEDREDLLKTLYSHVVSIYRPVIGPFPENPSPQEFWQWVKTVYDSMLATVSKEPVVTAFLVRVISELSTGTVPPGFQVHKEAHKLAMMEIVAIGQRCGAIRSDLPDRFLLSAVMNMVTACHRWIVSEIKAGRADVLTPDPILTLYKSAFAPVLQERIRLDRRILRTKAK